ncbi:MAG: hypothetical protein GY823_13770 [Flavobacteriaceae bacterium]|nr:hypothetical protein [Flavobacteriaceae bacterium]
MSQEIIPNEPKKQIDQRDVNDIVKKYIDQYGLNKDLENQDRIQPSN